MDKKNDEQIQKHEEQKHTVYSKVRNKGEEQVCSV